MLDQGTDNTETSNQIDISVASSSKQKDKTKKTNQGLKRSIQTETQQELEEITGQSGPLNLVFIYFDSRFQKNQNQIRKNKAKELAQKNEKSKLKLLNKKVTGYNTNLTQVQWKIYRTSSTTFQTIQFQRH